MAKLMVTVSCPIDGCDESLSFGPEALRVTAPHLNPDNPKESVVDIRPDAGAIHDAVYAHAAAYHPELHVNASADPDVSPDAARWTPEMITDD